MERWITVVANGEELGKVLTNRTLSIYELMWSLGFDITDEEDLKLGYEMQLEGFYLDDDGHYCFDEEAIELR